MCETAGQYEDQTILMLVKDSPGKGRRPIDIRHRVEQLLAIERRAKYICDNGIFSHKPCPYCGRRHVHKSLFSHKPADFTAFR